VSTEQGKGHKMINPNAKHKAKGIVTKLSRSYDESLNVTVMTDTGIELTELGFIYHKTLKIEDSVNITIGFRIVGDRYGIESIRKSNKKVI